MRLFRRKARPFNALFDPFPSPVSKNERAEHLVGLRFEERKDKGFGVIIDERLLWSDYDGFLWCAICNRDYPSCFVPPG